MTSRKHRSAHRYVALLRAINVGGHVVKMDRLRTEFDALGFEDVRTFIASGNVLFAAGSDDAVALEHRIERRLEQALGYPVATFLRSPAQLAMLVVNEPYSDRLDSASLYVGFLKSAPPDERRERALALRSELDEVCVRDREIFWMCRARSTDSTLSGARLEKALAAPATFRNVTTVRKLALLAATDVHAV
ncbi:MAG: DUF1697 domain-containing protein [Gemmatimonadaceae bacterium]